VSEMQKHQPRGIKSLMGGIFTPGFWTSYLRE
jgi:hypothetical protein